MENVKGLLMGLAWGYVQKIYKDFWSIGYSVHHWLLKGETMGVPQTRHRVIFIAIRKDIGFDPRNIDMTFNYKPITYGEIKTGVGKINNPTSVVSKNLLLALPNEKDIGEVLQRLGQKDSMFNEQILWEHRVCPTITGSGGFHRGTDKTYVSIEDIINASTFPQDYNFINRTINNVQYVCGMSVPPIMIKRVCEKILEHAPKIFWEVANG
jgi:DNA (cytosine-5)-methyltransferase 1